MNNILSLSALKHTVVFDMIHDFSESPFALPDKQYKALIESISYEDIVNTFTRQYIAEIYTSDDSFNRNKSVAKLIQLNTIAAFKYQATFYTYELLTSINEPASTEIKTHRLYDGKGNNNIMNFCEEIINHENHTINENITTLIEKEKAKFNNNKPYEFICMLGESIILLNAIASKKYNINHQHIEHWLQHSLAITSKMHSSINLQCTNDNEFSDTLSSNAILIIIACKMISLIDKKCPKSTLYLMKHIIVSIELCPALTLLITSSLKEESISTLLNE